MSKKNVSLKAIAAELGLSINTVSHAIRDMPDISKATKQKVREKALELGYMPNIVSQRLKKGEKPVVALLVSSFSNLYFNSLCNELIKIFKKKNAYDIQITYFDGDYMEALKQCILQRVDLILTHTKLTEEAATFAKLNGIKTILAGTAEAEADTDSVSVNDAMGCAQAARYLWSMHRCQRYLYVGIDYSLSEIRYSRFRQELRNLGVKDIAYLNYDKEGAQKLLECINDGYRSLFFYNDATAYSALAELDEIAIDIRKYFPDLHLIGFDGLCEAITGLKQITTIKIDYPLFASEIYKMIAFRMENPNAPFRHVTIPTSLHRR